MKNSIFKGRSINDSDSKLIYESKGDFHNLNPFDENTKKLAEFGINDWEQLYSLVKNEKNKGGLKSALNLQADEDINTLLEISESALSDYKIQQLNQTEIINCPLGAKKPEVIERITEKFRAPVFKDSVQFIDSNKKLNEVMAFDSVPAFALASSINHIPRLNVIRSQGDRGTCTAFAVSAANEFSFYNKMNVQFDLSEQHLFYETKLVEGDEICGSWISSSMQVVSDRGQCREGTWAYILSLPCIQKYGKPGNADSDAINFKNTYFAIDQNNIVALQQTLSSGRIIPFSIPVFDSWYESAETYRTGRITMPLPGEQESGGHAMDLVGYQDDVDSPGGGFFLVRNSWGTDWAHECVYGAGYGVIPYAYIKQYNWEAFAF
jgi:C1A family cysteine protease